jgi:hypothetical protein
MAAAAARRRLCALLAYRQYHVIRRRLAATLVHQHGSASCDNLMKRRVKRALADRSHPGMKTVRIFFDRIRDRIRLEGF